MEIEKQSDIGRNPVIRASVFALLCLLLALAVWRLGKADEKLETLYAGIGLAEKESSETAKEIDSTDGEVAYLQELFGPDPAEQSVIRTQHAIQAEIRDLRTQLARRLGNHIYLAVDSRANKLYLRKGVKLLLEADCSVGKGGKVRDKATGRAWEFITPRGEFRVKSKMEEPLWRKPDWAFVENGEPVPGEQDPARLVAGELGKYALNIGNGYLLHGTKNEGALGRAVTHGCVRLGAEALEKIYKAVPVGAAVYIY